VLKWISSFRKKPASEGKTPARSASGANFSIYDSESTDSIPAVCGSFMARSICRCGAPLRPVVNLVGLCRLTQVSLVIVLDSAISELKRNQKSKGCFQLPSGMQTENSLVVDELSDKSDLHFTGHSVEWAALYLSESELSEQWLLDAVRFLVRKIRHLYPKGKPKTFASDSECIEYGNLCHALSAL
jgi:hypothetical protein